MDEAVICPECVESCVTENTTNNAIDAKNSGKPKGMAKKVKPIWIILGAVILVLVILATILFIPRNLKMDDFKKTNLVNAILRYGCPTGITSTEDQEMILKYEDKVKFYGITPYMFMVYPEENEVVFFFRSEDGNDVIKKLNRYCDFDKSLSIFYKYSYEDMDITVDTDGTYVLIEID